MKTQLLSIVMLMCSIAVTTGCKKEKIKGCTNSSAENFDSNAEEDDGNCSYKGSYVFWCNTLNAGETIDVSCDGVVSELSSNYTGAPACGTNNAGAISMERTWKGSPATSFPATFYYYDSSGGFVTSINSTATFQAKTCTNRMVGI
ncbi:MAG: hypothetical protein ACJ77K_17575 [Bacteroidia bacterium]